MSRGKDALRALLGKPVCNDAWRAKETARQAQLFSWFDWNQKDEEQSARLLTRTAQGAGRIQWLLCNFTHPYGGVFTALRMADFLESRGWENQIVIYDNSNFSIAPQWDAIARYFPNLRPEQFFFSRPEELPPARAAVATFWTSAYALLKLKQAEEKFYLIQDFEPAFYPAGAEYALAENTYRMPFHRLYNTPGLGEFLSHAYPPEAGVRTLSFTPACDERYAFCPKLLTRPVRVLCYTRPDTPRNAFALMLAFGRVLKERYGDAVHLTAAGAGMTKALRAQCAGTFEISGVQPYEALPEFYGSFHFVVAFMLTKHPSYLPFEAMACGCTVLTNENAANRWLFRDGENCLLAKPALTPLLEAFERGMEPETYRRVVFGGRASVEAFSWERELSRVEEFFRGNGKKQEKQT